MHFLLVALTALLFAGATWSLSQEDEGIRGLGRVVFGGAIFTTGIVFAAYANAGWFLSLVIIVCGLYTAGAGFRKYRRRNLAAAPAKNDDPSVDLH